MKKCTVILMALLLSFAMLFCFACNDSPDNSNGITATLVISDGSKIVKVVTDDTTADHVDKWMIEMNEEKKISLTYTDSEYGMNISTLEGIEVNGFSTYFAFYADDEDNTNDAWGSYSYEGKRYYSCAFGQRDMPLKDGCTYILVYTVYIG